MSNHDEAERRVRAWLRDEAHGELPDWVLRETFGRTREMPQQRGLHGWFAAFAHGARSMARGRTIMLTVPGLILVVAVTALATAVIVSLSSPPADQPAAALETAPRTFAPFSGKTQFGDCVGSGPIVVSSPGFVRETDPAGAYCVNPIVEDFGDPRLRGEFRVWSGGNDGYGLGPTVWSHRFSMHDAEGKWVQRPSLSFNHADGSGPNEVVVMDGSGAYDGLSLVAEVDLFDSIWTWRGYIIEGDLPPVPEVRLPE